MISDWVISDSESDTEDVSPPISQKQKIPKTDNVTNIVENINIVDEYLDTVEDLSFFSRTQTTLPFTNIGKKKCEKTASKRPISLTQSKLSFMTPIESKRSGGSLLTQKGHEFISHIDEIFVQIDAFKNNVMKTETFFSKKINPHKSWIDFFIFIDETPPMKTLLEKVTFGLSQDIIDLKFSFMKIPTRVFNTLVIIHKDNWTMGDLLNLKASWELVDRGVIDSEPQLWFKKGVLLLVHDLITKGKVRYHSQWKPFWGHVVSFIQRSSPYLQVIHIDEKTTRKSTKGLIFAKTTSDVEALKTTTKNYVKLFKK